MAERNSRILDRVKLGSAVTAGLAACALAATAAAQSPRGGADPRQSVTVDLSVLDGLGPPPTVPGLLLPTVPRTQQAPPQARPAPPPQRRLRLPNVSEPPALVRPGRATTAKPLKPRPPRQTAAPQVAPNPPPRKPDAVAAVTPPQAAPRRRGEVPAAPVTRRAAPQAAVRPPRPPAPPTPEAVPPPPPPETVAPPTPPAPAAGATILSVARPKPESSRPAKQSARPRAAPAEDGMVRLVFAKAGDGLTDANSQQLDPQVAELKRDEELKLRIVAYASGEGGSAISARRLSLSRALAVRSYLMDRGISASRLEVRALGNRIQDGPPDRVDTTVLPR